MSTIKSNKQVATPGQVFAFAARVATEVYSWELSGETVQAAKDEKDHPVWAAIRNTLVPQPDALAQQVMKQEQIFVPRIQILSERPKPCAKRTVGDQVVDLKDMYRELRWTWTESGLVIPQHQKGIDRLLVFADTGFNNNQLFGVCNNSFPSWSYVTDLNSGIPAKNDQRHPSRGAYAIWVRDDNGPDRDLMGLSANQIKGRSLNTLTTLEREFLELVYYQETGRHLDVRTFTLCSGSRYSGGNVPYASWLVDKFRVYWCDPDSKDPTIGARQAVTL